MLEFLKENYGTIIVGLALAAVVVLIILSYIRKRKKGISSCGSNCSNCPMHGNCHKS